jgi:hypothetical protein
LQAVVVARLDHGQAVVAQVVIAHLLVAVH